MRSNAVAVVFVLCTAFTAAADDSPPADLTQLSLEELSRVEISSVSKREEPLESAPAAVTVISNEDLRRTSATSIPEALRLVPGLHVGQVSSSGWEVSARGFSSLQSANLLVLNDTRSVYTPLYAGVFWDVQDVLMEDIDRIEVIRGPGASLWGSNAVDGVINVTSKSAKETQGAYFEGAGGTVQRAEGAIRYGGQLSGNLWFRVFAKGLDDAGEDHPAGPNDDHWKLGHLGFRADWMPSATDSVTFQGDTYTGDIGQVVASVIIIGRPGPQPPLVAQVAGGNLLARWTHAFAPGFELSARAYYDNTHRDDPAVLDDLNTVDLDVQQRFQLPFRQDVLLGVEWRSMDDRDRGKGLFLLSPQDSIDELYSGFIQDQVTLCDSLKLTAGTKLEHNDFSGFEYQPTVRLAWAPGAMTLWGAISRAVRVPTRLERDVDITVTDPTQDPVIKLLGTRTFGAERLLAYEVGLRLQREHFAWLDLAAYYDVHRGLASLELGTPFTDPSTGHTIEPLINQNLTDGTGKGVEASLTVTPVRSVRLVGNYTWQVLSLTPHGNDYNHGGLTEGETPRSQASLQSFVDLPWRLQADLFLRYAGALPTSGALAPDQYTGAYTTLDARVAWQATERLELSANGRSLLQAHHREFPGDDEVKRSVFAKLAGRF